MISAGDSVSALARRLGLPAGEYSISISEDGSLVSLRGKAADGLCVCDLSANYDLDSFQVEYDVASCSSRWTESAEFLCSEKNPSSLRARLPAVNQNRLSRAFASTVGTEKFAVVLIDAYELSGNVPANQRAEDRNMQEVLARANLTGTPVFEVITANEFNEGTRRSLASLRRDNWLLVEKVELDAFRRTDFSEKLSRMGITSLIIMGFNQLYCVRSTVESALDLGYSVYTSFDVMQGNIDESNPVPGSETNFEIAVEYYSGKTDLVESYKNFPIMRD